MEIGDGNAVGGPGGEDLLRRMQQAHDKEVERAREADFDEARGAAAGEVEGAAGAEEVGEADPVERRVMDTARRALEGQFDSPEQARGEVVETIVEERYSGMVGGDREGFVESVKDTLADDVAFKSEVDNMLMHAARRLGREDAA